MTPKRYTVEITDGIAVATDEDGCLLTSETFEFLIENLRYAHKIERRRERMELVIRSLGNDQWVFPHRRSETFKSGPCVYFAVNDVMAGRIKIGFSETLAGRMRNLSRQHGSDMRVLAFLRAARHKMLETAFHNYFAEHRCRGEWFDADPVLDYLRKAGWQES